MKNRILVFLFLLQALYGSGQTMLHRIDSLMNHFYKPSLPGAVMAGSHTKQFTAYALFDLYYQGRFLLSD